MANANVFAQLLAQPVKSVQEYDDERAAREVSRIDLQGKRRANALAEAATTQQTGDRAALQRYAGESGGDQNKLIQLLRGSGSAGLMTQADGLEKSMLDRRNTESQIGERTAKTGSEQAKAAVEKLSLIGQLAGGIRDQSTYEAALNFLGASGFDMAKLGAPAQYDPAVVERFRTQAMTEKDRVEQQFKQVQQQEVGRHNVATEQGTIRGQDVSAATTRRGQDMTDGRARDFTAISQQTKATPKPMPGTAVKLQNEDLEAIGTFRGIDSDLAALESQLNDGKLKLGLVGNAMGTAQNAMGMSSENSRNLASFKAKLENMRNSVLLLNKGVQTEGDANRAMAEIMANINDGELVKQRLAEIRALNKRAADLRKNNIDLLRSNYGAEPMDFSKYDQQPAALDLPKPGAPAKTKSGATASNW